MMIVGGYNIVWFKGKNDEIIKTVKKENTFVHFVSFSIIKANFFLKELLQ